MSDSISNFLTQIRNGYMARKDNVRGRYSKLHLSVAELLKHEGYLQDCAVVADDKGHQEIELTLKYVGESPALSGIERASRPGRREYHGCDDIPRVLNGLGINILTTSRGVLVDREARRARIGGELLCRVW